MKVTTKFLVFGAHVHYYQIFFRKIEDGCNIFFLRTLYMASGCVNRTSDFLRFSPISKISANKRNNEIVHMIEFLIKMYHRTKTRLFWYTRYVFSFRTDLEPFNLLRREELDPFGAPGIGGLQLLVQQVALFQARVLSLPRVTIFVAEKLKLSVRVRVKSED